MNGRPRPEDLLAHAQFLRRLAARMLDDEHLAEDVAQEALVAGLSAPPRAGYHLRSWLVTVTRNFARMRMRSRSRRAKREQALPAADATVPPDVVAERLETGRHLVAAVTALPEPYRETVVLRFFDDLSPTEIAARLGVPAATVRTRLARALALLRTRFDDEPGGRAAWTVAFTVLLGSSRRPAVAAAGAALTGGGILAMKKVALALVLLALLVAAVWWWPASEGTAPPAPAAVAASRPEPAGPDVAAAAAAATEADRPAGELVVRGRAVYADRRPFDGPLSVVAAEDPYAALGSSPRPADGEGRAVVTGLPPGEFRLAAELPDGAVVYGEPFLLPREEEVGLVVDAGRAPFAGRVVADEDGSPVAGATVAVTGHGVGVEIAKVGVATDADGAFRVDLPEGPVHLVATAEGFTPASAHTSGEREVEIRLVRRGGLSGRALSATDGKPLAGVAVFARPVFGEGAGPFRTTSAEDGTYAFPDLPAGTVLLYARGGGGISRGGVAPGAEAFDADPVEIPPRGAVLRDVLLVPAGAAAGRVLGTEGKPAGGVPVRVEVDASAGNAPPLSWLGTFRTEVARVTTDPDGRFEAPELVPGARYRFTAAPAGAGPASAGPHLALAGRTTEVEIRLPPERRLRVRVVTKEKEPWPLAGAQVYLYVPTARGGRRPLPGEWRTGPDGAVVAERLPAGELLLLASHPDCLPGRIAVRVEPGADAAGFGLEPGEEIAGRVTFADGPVRDAWLSVSRRTEEVPPHSYGKTVAVRPDGSFRARGLVPGHYFLSVGLFREGRPWGGRAEAETGDRDVRITVEPSTPAAAPASSSVLALRVRDGAGRPVPTARVTAWRVSPAYGAEPRSDTVWEGRARIYVTPIAGARFYVEVGGAAGCGPAFVGPVEPGGEEIDVVLPPERSLRGRVTDGAGRGVPGAWLEARAVRSELSGRGGVQASAASGPDGFFTFDGLGDGPYELSVRPPPGFVAPAPRRVSAGTDVEVDLAAGRDVVVTIRGPDGEPLEGSASAYGTGGRVIGLADAAGRALLTGLDPEEEYRLVVGVFEPGFASRIVERWRPADVDVRLDAIPFLRGRVRTPAGDPAPDALLEWRAKGGGRWERAIVHADGSFLIREVTEGGIEMKVRTIFSPVLDPDREIRTVMPGDGDVELVADPGLPIEVVPEGWPPNASGGVILRIRRPGREPFLGTSVMLPGPRFRGEGLRADDRVDVLLRPAESDLVGFATGLAPGDEPRPVRLTEGKRISGRVLLPGGGYTTSVQIVEFPIQVKADADGRFEIRGLPEGTFTLRAWASSRTGRLTGEVEARAGETVEILLGR